MHGKRRMLLGMRNNVAVYGFVLGLALHSGACGVSPETSEEDVCLFLQNGIRARSMLQLRSEYMTNITWHVAESSFSGATVPIKPNDDATVNVTSDENATVVVEFMNADNATSRSEKRSNVTANITPETIKIKIKQLPPTPSQHWALTKEPDDDDGDNEGTVNITSGENTTVVVDVDNADNASNAAQKPNVTANVTRNTTKVNIEHKVVKHAGQRPVEVDTRTETEDNQGKRELRTPKKTIETNETTDDTGNTTSKRKHGPEKPFAKENVTVHKRILNITRRTNSTHNETQNVTIKEIVKTVTVASPFHIASIYMILFVPVIVAWALYYHHGQQMRHYMWLLPFTMCSMCIGQDLVNQSLTLILMAPNAITAIQALAMGIGALVYSIWANWPDLRVESHQVLKASSWLGVAAFFSLYQIMNHVAYAFCSLSERTVIGSLAPLLVLALERVCFSDAIKPVVTFNAKIALVLMVVGAMLFSIQSPSFSIDGLGTAALLLLSQLPYRLSQRKFLAEGPPVPISMLTCIDGFMLGIPALTISAARNGYLWTDFGAFLETSIVFMLFLSIVTFAGLHVCTLAMLRLGSATSYLVFSNVAALGTITLGICFFGDAALGTTLACMGLATNVASGMWYSVEVQQGKDGCSEQR